MQAITFETIPYNERFVFVAESFGTNSEIFTVGLPKSMVILKSTADISMPVSIL